MHGREFANFFVGLWEAPGPSLQTELQNSVSFRSLYLCSAQPSSLPNGFATPTLPSPSSFQSSPQSLLLSPLSPSPQGPGLSFFSVLCPRVQVSCIGKSFIVGWVVLEVSEANSSPLPRTFTLLVILGHPFPPVSPHPLPQCEACRRTVEYHCHPILQNDTEKPATLMKVTQFVMSVKSQPWNSPCIHLVSLSVSQASSTPLPHHNLSQIYKTSHLYFYLTFFSPLNWLNIFAKGIFWSSSAWIESLSHT